MARVFSVEWRFFGPDGRDLDSFGNPLFIDSEGAFSCNQLAGCSLQDLGIRNHAHLANVTANQHHAESHAHNGIDGSGTVAHSATTGQTANDHHAEDHATRHSNGGADEINVENLGTTETNASFVLAPDGIGGVEFRAETGGEEGSSAITVAELDGTPSVNPVDTIIFDQGDGFTVTDNADGSVTIGHSGGSGAGAPFVRFRPQQNEPPAANYATLDTRNSHPVLDFDGATDEEAVFSAILPPGYGGGGLTVSTWWAFTTAVSGSLSVQAAIERINLSGLDIDADSFAAFKQAGGSAPGTSGQVIKIDIVFASGAEMDGLLAGEVFRLKIRRDADGTSGTDDITTDAELMMVQVAES